MTTGQVASEAAVTRSYITHKPNWQKFQPIRSIENNSTYQRQYAHVYHQRLAVLSKKIWKNIESTTEGNSSRHLKRAKNILGVTDDSDQVYCVTGTITREIIKEDIYSSSSSSSLPINFEYYLEDESGRMVLSFKNDEMHLLVTGVVVAVEGMLTNGIFHVSKLHVPNTQASLDATSSTTFISNKNHATDDKDPIAKSILLISDLNCGDPSFSALPRDMLVSFLSGCFGVKKAQHIGHIIVAGGSVSSSPKAHVTASLQDLDAFLLQLASLGLWVDVVPGKNDPTTANWPQRPIHPSLLPCTSTVATACVHFTPNPYMSILNDETTVVMGTDGTNVKDLVFQLNRGKTQMVPHNDDMSNMTSELDALDMLLSWSHLCPTGPDSVPTVPHINEDPMVIERLPHLLFSGQADHFATRTRGQCRLVCVPSFSTTGEAVLVHLLPHAPPSVELLCFKGVAE